MLRSALFFAPVLVAPLLWAANFIAAKSVHDVSDPLWLNSARWATASLVLAPILWRDRRNIAKVMRSNFTTLMLLALLGVVGSNTLVFWGLQHSSATEVGVVYGLTPFLILVFSRMTGGARLETRQSYGGVVAFAGVCLILTGGEFAVLYDQTTKGALLTMAGASLWAVYSVRLHRAQLMLEPMSLVAVLATLGAMMMGPLLWLRPAPNADVVPEVFSAVAFLGIGGSAFAFWAWGMAVARVGACRTGVGLQLIPVFGALLAWAFLDEVPTRTHLSGIALVVTGLYLVCQPGLGSVGPPCLKAVTTTGQTDAPRDDHPQDSRNRYLGRDRSRRKRAV